MSLRRRSSLACAVLLTGCFGLTSPSARAAGLAPDTVAATAAGLRAALLGPSPDAPPLAQGPRFARSAGSRRSVPLAAVMSAAVPGLGQAYNRQWIKAAAGVILEAALVYGYVDAHRRGLDEEALYQAYAHRHWSPLQYAAWLEDYSDWLPETPRMEVDEGLVAGIDFLHPEAWSAAEVGRVRSFFDQIHAIEAEVVHPETGASFSHKLPYFGEQQYYELIGKYFQFAPGWEDYPEWRAGEAFTDAIDPEKTGPGGDKVNVQGRFWEYDDMAEHANDLLRRASRLTALIMINHAVAVIDAAVFAKLHNDRLQTDLTLAYDASGKVRPHASVRLRF